MIFAAESSRGPGRRWRMGPGLVGAVAAAVELRTGTLWDAGAAAAGVRHRSDRLVASVGARSLVVRPGRRGLVKARWWGHAPVPGESADGFRIASFRRRSGSASPLAHE